ncbi:hypothetical protein TA05_17570 [Citrobacter rodentium]|nr:hypothetical protein TA05_17570 [Citrobacter rodentium]
MKSARIVKLMDALHNPKMFNTFLTVEPAKLKVILNEVRGDRSISDLSARHIYARLPVNRNSTADRAPIGREN